MNVSMNLLLKREDNMYGERWKTCKHCDYFIRY